jgi:hypothetical protein
MNGAGRQAVVALVMALTASAASAQAIFRCGDSYSQTPCVGARMIEGAAPATPAQHAEARAVAAREQQLALEMVRDRHERERALRPAMAGSLGPAPVAAGASAPGKKHASARKHVAPIHDDRDFVAAVPKAKQ